MLMPIKTEDINYCYMIKTVNSDTELLFAKAATFQLETEHTQLISLTNNNSYCST